MSYILEALKRSQQERDLGQVPTLETPPSASDTSAREINRWGFAAVGLAGFAVVIALYAALRGAPQALIEPPDAADPGPAIAVDGPEEGQDLPKQGPTDASAQVTQTPAPATRVAEGQDELPGAPGGVEAPGADENPPRVTSQAAPPTPSSEQSAPAREPSAPAREQGGRVPEDLRQEIEAFKRQIRGESSAEPEAAAADVRPQELRLPREVRERLPAFLMTVHIYDQDPDKRFVMINSRKHREGDRTRQDLLVEEILPDGAVLSYEGHRFFRHR